jgi:hypothetical protein
MMGLTLKEESGLIGDKVTGEILTGVCETGNECSPSVCSLE